MTLIQLTPYDVMSNIDQQYGMLILKNSDFKGVVYKEGNIVLSFRNCRFEQLVIENDHAIDFKQISIAFFDCIIDHVRVSQIISENISIGFYGSIVSGRIKNGKLKSVDFNNCLIPSNMFLIDVPNVTISYTKENIEDNHWRQLMLRFMMTGADALLNKPINFHIHTPNRVFMTSNFEAGDKRFQPSLNLNYDKGNAHVETKINGLLLKSLSISGSPFGEISIENTQINSLYVYNFVPQGNVSFYNVRPIASFDKETKIGIHNSKLDGVEFDNISFDSYPIISFYRTKFSKAIFTSCDFPKDYRTFSRFVAIDNVHYPDRRPKNYDKAQYEIFLQLKKALEDGGNFYEAQKLQAISHEALKQIKSINSWDRGILNINSWSNSHGLSIKRPFWGLLISSILIYCLYLLSLDRLYINSNAIDWHLVGHYFAFIDLTHRNNFLVEKNELTGWSVFFDYAGKLVVGFFIYQFIAAFRKYGKR